MADADHRQRSGVTVASEERAMLTSEAKDNSDGMLQAQWQDFINSLKYKEIAEYVQLMNKPRKLIVNNLLSGISRGVGIALGVTVFFVTALYLLRALGALNLPIVGDYIADIVKVVQAQLDGRSF